MTILDLEQKYGRLLWEAQDLSSNLCNKMLESPPKDHERIKRVIEKARVRTNRRLTVWKALINAEKW